ncbi:MAG: hypothetical protein ABI268_10820 [Rhodanobacter sp.]
MTTTTDCIVMTTYPMTTFLTWMDLRRHPISGLLRQTQRLGLHGRWNPATAGVHP